MTVYCIMVFVFILFSLFLFSSFRQMNVKKNQHLNNFAQYPFLLPLFLRYWKLKPMFRCRWLGTQLRFSDLSPSITFIEVGGTEIGQTGELYWVMREREGHPTHPERDGEHSYTEWYKNKELLFFLRCRLKDTLSR